MHNWEIETGVYISRLEDVASILDVIAERPVHIPKGPVSEQPSELQSLLHRAVNFLELGSWIRSRETVTAIVLLWKDGSISSATPLVRLVYEIWAVTNYLVSALNIYNDNKNITKLAKVVNKVFEGAKIEVLLPWGTATSETPVHVLDGFRELNKTHEKAMERYEYLCESSHPNYPRYMELWLLGKEGDNWSNDVVLKRGHELLENTVSALEESVSGINSNMQLGFELCGKHY